MHAEDLILVTGATGNTGSALLQQLEARGTRVRAMVRSLKDEARLAGTAAATVVANFDDPASLSPALEGVTRAYLVTPSSPHAEAQQVGFAEQAVAAGVKHLVKLRDGAIDRTALAGETRACGCCGVAQGSLSKRDRRRQSGRPGQ